jgi:hypothetical protein
MPYAWITENSQKITSYDFGASRQWPLARLLHLQRNDLIDIKESPEANDP